MLGGFTHWAVYEDCRRFARFDHVLDRMLREVVDAEAECAQLGAIMHNDDPWQTPVIAAARAGWSEMERPADLGKRLAFALGGLVHAGCDEVLDPLTAEIVAEAGQPPDVTRAEIRAYHDAHVFERAFLDGHEDAFNRFVMGGHGVSPTRAGEELVVGFVLRALQSCHTIEPDMAALETWLDRLFASRDRLPGAVARAVAAQTEPDPAKVARYVTRPGFYDAADPAIEVARALQRNPLVDEDRALQAVAPGTNTSLYGRAIERGVGRLRSASAFWRGEDDGFAVVPSASERDRQGLAARGG